jgi:hypothetical protein
MTDECSRSSLQGTRLIRVMFHYFTANDGVLNFRQMHNEVSGNEALLRHIDRVSIRSNQLRTLRSIHVNVLMQLNWQGQGEGRGTTPCPKCPAKSI